MPRSLGSVPPGSRVLVVDAQSSDATVEFARAAGAEVIVRPWAGFVETRRFALARVGTPWTFMLDADEALDARCAAAVSALEPLPETDAYRVARSTFFCGRPMRHGAWGAEAPLRLFRSVRATLVAQPAAGGGADVHERWVVPGAVARLEGTLLHDSYPDVATYAAKFARYTSLEALGVSPSGRTLVRAALVALLRAPWLLVARGGWRDGWRGAFVAVASAAYPVAVAWKALRVRP